MKFKPLFILGLLFFLSGCFGARKQATINAKGPSNNPQTDQERSQATSVNARKMTVAYQLLDDNESIRVFLELDIPRLEASSNINKIKEEFSFSYGLLPNYASKEFIETKKIDMSTSDIRKVEDKFYMSFSVPKKPVISNVMLIDIVDTFTGQKILQDLIISYAVTKVRQVFSPFDPSGQVPIFGRYFLKDEPLQIKSINGEQANLQVVYYQHEFEPANPPMATVSDDPIKNLVPDSSFTLSTNQVFSFKKKGLYLMKKDANDYYGMTFYVSDLKYPKITRVDEVVDPLVYITTQEEYDGLMDSDDTKKAFDRLWLKLSSGNVKLARLTIREYFRRVKMANKFFTTFKPGWQTDMGMIFIIYDSPNRIIRNDNVEHWIYTQNATFSEIKFSFRRKPNQFTDDHFTLVRYPDYEQVWYPAIELLREGKI
ncbi:MAG: GWxTD domain-containing protein [Bacteroidota bacterium]